MWGYWKHYLPAMADDTAQHSRKPCVYQQSNVNADKSADDCFMQNSEESCEKVFWEQIEPDPSNAFGGGWKIWVSSRERHASSSNLFFLNHLREVYNEDSRIQRISYYYNVTRKAACEENEMLVPLVVVYN